MKTSDEQKVFAFRGARVWNDFNHEKNQTPSLFSHNK